MTAAFTVVVGVQPVQEYTVVECPDTAVVVAVEGEDAFGRKTSSTAIPMATKTTTATASAEIASLARGLLTERVKFAKL